MATSDAELTAEVEALRKQLASLQTTLKQKEAQLQTVWPYSRSYGKTSISTILGAPDGGKSMIGTTLRVGGWVKTGREAGAGAFAFLEVSDGSNFECMQASSQQSRRLVMVTKEVAEAVGGLKHLVMTGTSVLVEGELSATPEGTKQVQPQDKQGHRQHTLHLKAARAAVVSGGSRAAPGDSSWQGGTGGAACCGVEHTATATATALLCQDTDSTVGWQPHHPAQGPSRTLGQR
ncbi:hypothetical protein QJQ45_007860 [Haematococcus lacustris]|nr:hypothetical protein QJQ45_007859 [Haematococcus lacustris]KAJ9504770.1 hypothetical protein QJQ45_007860 [Haematococcus lacustris]